jgi:uncharacterized protein (DUF2141 family)
MRPVFALAALALTLSTPTAMAQSGGRLIVDVSGLRNDNGVVRCGLFSSPDTFRKPGQEMRGVVARPKAQRASCVFNGIPSGTYAVAVFHAERNESQIEYGLFGKPKQGFGFSRNPSTTLGPPGYEAAAFNYSGGSQSLAVTLRY